MKNMEIRIEDIPPLFQREFQKLLRKEEITREEKEDFMNLLKGKVSSRVVKSTEKILKGKVKEEFSLSPGPIYRPKDISYLQQKINEFFSSPYKENFPLFEKIEFYLFGSLVNGYCNNPRKESFGKPSDLGRVSDVDILIVLSNSFFEKIFSGNRRIIVRVKGDIRTIPIGKDTTFKEESTGPFAQLYPYLSEIAFGGRTDRQVHIVFISLTAFINSNFTEEPNIKIAEITTPVK